MLAQKKTRTIISTKQQTLSEKQQYSPGRQVFSEALWSLIVSHKATEKQSSLIYIFVKSTVVCCLKTHLRYFFISVFKIKIYKREAKCSICRNVLRYRTIELVTIE